MDREGAEDLIYESYLAAERLQKDKGIQTVRDPTLLEHVLSSLNQKTWRKETFQRHFSVGIVAD